MELTRVTWGEQDGVGIVTLNRPERLNAIDLPTIVELDHLVERAANRPSIRCLLITGNGRAFSAGADVKEWGDPAGEREPDADGWAPRMHRLMARDHTPQTVLNAFLLFDRASQRLCEGQDEDLRFEQLASVSMDEYLQMIAEEIVGKVAETPSHSGRG